MRRPFARPFWRPFWRTVAWKLSLALVLLSAVALGTVGVVSNVSTHREFVRFVREQGREELARRAGQYAERHGGLAGFRPFKGRPLPALATGDTDDASYEGPYVVLDVDGRTLTAAAGIPIGARLTGARAASAAPVRAGGRLVGHVALSGFAPRLDPRSADFLARTTDTIRWTMLGTALAAVLTGWLLSRALLEPLRELRRGLDAVRRGREPAPPERVPRDEFGEALVAFHEMHASVAQHQRARRQLTANIAHDLNTPLNVISGTLEGLLDGTFPPTRERLGQLHAVTRHLAALVGDLRFLSLADAGELHLDLAPDDLAGVVRDAASGFAELAARGGVRLRVDAPAGGTNARFDTRRVTQVLQNLLGNALRFTPSGGEVAVEVRSRGAAWEVRVRDTGSGIPEEHLPHVFERLYRADEARGGEGSGLGLAICRSIVGAHGGRIGVESAPGRGTTVTFTLPAAPTGPSGLGEAAHDSPVLARDAAQPLRAAEAEGLLPHAVREGVASRAVHPLQRGAHGLHLGQRVEAPVIPRGEGGVALLEQVGEEGGIGDGVDSAHRMASL